MKKSERKLLYCKLFSEQPCITNSELANLSGVTLGTAKSLVGEMVAEGLIYSKITCPGVRGGRKVTLIGEQNEQLS